MARKLLLTTGEVARFCEVAPRTVNGWIDSGILDGFRLPGSKDRRVRVDVLYTFMKTGGFPLAGVCRYMRLHGISVAE